MFQKCCILSDCSFTREHEHVKNGIPAFRHTILSSSDNDFLHKKLENLVDIAIYECEKYYPSFQQVLFEEISARQSLVFANFEVIGTS